MSTRVDYNKLINYVEKSNKNVIEITQNTVKRLVNNELPKSFFSNKYITDGKNELARFIIEKGYEFEVVEPKIIIKKKSA